MALFPRKAAPAAPEPAHGALEADVLHWSQEADKAAAALAVALGMRRATLSRLIGQTALRAKASLNNLFSGYAIARSIGFHVDKASGRSLLNHMGAAHVAVGARTSFEHSASVAIAASASGRKSPDPDSVGSTDPLKSAGGATAPALP